MNSLHIHEIQNYYSESITFPKVSFTYNDKQKHKEMKHVI